MSGIDGFGSTPTGGGTGPAPMGKPAASGAGGQPGQAGANNAALVALLGAVANLVAASANPAQAGNPSSQRANSDPAQADLLRDLAGLLNGIADQIGQLGTGGSGGGAAQPRQSAQIIPFDRAMAQRQTNGEIDDCAAANDTNPLPIDLVDDQPNDIKEIAPANIFENPAQGMSERREVTRLGPDGLFDRSFVVPNVSVPQALLGQHIVSDETQLRGLAELTGLDPQTLPNVDFQSQALVYTTRDANGPRPSLEGELGADGILRTIGVVPAIGFLPSGSTAFDFFAVDRDGIRALATENPLNSDPLH